jgi:hypothetical protein
VSGHGHCIKRLTHDDFRLSWVYNKRVANRGRHLIWPTRITRDTDRAGAERFAKKWGCPMPEEPKGV